MHNRAKCKLCQSIIESISLYDEITCTCGHISVMGGDKMGCRAIEWKNFLRVDDEGNEIVPTIQESPKPAPITKREMLEALDLLIKKIEEMPQNAMIISINHYDYLTLLVWLSSFCKLCLSDLSDLEVK